MAGSQQYLSLLDNTERLLGVTDSLPFDHWAILAGAWEQLQGNIEAHDEKLINGALVFLATEALRIWSKEQQLTYADTIATAKDLHIRKNAGYAGASEIGDPWANFRLASRLGITPVQGVFVRMTDKWSRIQSLRKDSANEQVGESLMDTIMDLAAYALIAYCLMEEPAYAPVVQ